MTFWYCSSATPKPFRRPAASACSRSRARHNAWIVPRVTPSARSPSVCFSRTAISSAARLETRVDRAARDPLRAVPERVLQPDGDLFGRTIGERDGADALRCEPSGVDEMVDPGDEAERLPGAGSRHHEDGTERRFDGEALLRKRVEIHE